jgi:hypothetical protein
VGPGADDDVLVVADQPDATHASMLTHAGRSERLRRDAQSRHRN